MALVVDAGGKVIANPNTGRILGDEKSTGGAYAPSANNNVSSITEAVGNVLRNQLPRIKSSVPSVKRNNQAPTAIPSVATASMPLKIDFRQTNDIQPISAFAPVGTAASMGESNVSIPTTSIDRSAMEAIDNTLGIDPKHQAALDVWEQQAAEREGRDARNANVWGEAYDMNGADLNGFEMGGFDNQLDYVGNTPTNDAYIRYFMNQGMSEEDAKNVMHHDRNWWENLVGGDREYAGDVEVIDDGTSFDYNHLTSDHMTGTQYRKYSEMGMGGLPYDEIVPSQVYSKRAEQVNNGFIPFTPDMRSYVNMVSDNVLQAPSRITKAIGDWRQALSPDYTISIGDKSFSGRDFDKMSPAYIEGYEYESRYNPEKFLTNSTGSLTPYIKEYEVPDSNGNLTYHYGGLASDDGGTRIYPNDDGTYKMFFNDGSNVDVSQDYIDQISQNGFLETGRVPVSEAKGVVPTDLDSLNNIDYIMQASDESGLSPLEYAEVTYIPDLVLPDGQRLGLTDAERIYRNSEITPNYDEYENDNNVTPEISLTSGQQPSVKRSSGHFYRGVDDDEDPSNDISYQFSSGLLPFTDNKPQRLTKQEMLGPEGWDFSDLGNNMWDWTFGSIPISMPGKLPWLLSLANGSLGLSGIDPGRYDPNTGGYSLSAGSYDDQGNLRYGVTNANGERDEDLSNEGRYWNAFGNAFVPLTEKIAGDIGSDPLKKGINRITGGMFELPNYATFGQVARNALMGMVGEGVEEDIGNIFDDFTQYGLRGAFADPILDENGDVKRDMMGAEIRDLNTPLEQRIANFWNPEDIGNSFAGGAAVDVLMNSLLAPIDRDNFFRQALPAIERDRARRQTGVKQFVDPFEDEEE